MIKGILITTDSKGSSSIQQEGEPSLLVKEIRKYRAIKDFPKGVKSLEVWTPNNGCIDRVTKAKIEAQAEHDAEYAKTQKTSKKETE